jgi:DNA-3-methyladenine glycosylase II
MTPEVLSHLSEADEILGGLIQTIGGCELKPEKKRSPFESLVRAVAHQQLHGTAAERILGRFLEHFPGKRFPDPADLAAIPDEALRKAGFSGSKTAAIRDIAEKSLSGVVPSSREIARMPDEMIIERLTQCRGVGRWTVEMLLIFKLGRPDVLPIDDFGVRHGFKVTYRKLDFPKPKDLLRFGERWRPYRTTASWYLWRAADAARLAAKKKK